MILIRPTHERPLLELFELWPFRYLFLILVWRTLKVRYQQTAIGIAWAVLQPLLMTIVFTVIFGLLAHLPTDGKPYPIFVLSGLLVWQFVAQSCQHASTTIVANYSLVTRIFFPRILLPLASLAACLFDLIWVLGLLAVFMLWYGVAPTLGILAFFPMLVLAAITVLGVSLWLGTLYVSYRDIGHLLPFMIQLWMFASPVIYPLSLLPPKYAFLYALNPLVVVIETSRWAFCGGTPPQVWMVATAWTVALILCLTGLWFFRRQEGTFADIV